MPGRYEGSTKVDFILTDFSQRLASRVTHVDGQDFADHWPPYFLESEPKAAYAIQKSSVLFC
jgi:hypothetical protein